MFIIAIITFLFALIALPVAMKAKHPQDKSIARRVTGGLFFLAAVITVVSSFTIVAPRTVAVTTEFGQPTSSFGNGLHPVVPWAEVTEMDGSVQTDVYSGENKVEARLKHQSMAEVETTVKWRIRPGQAKELFLDYREFENIRESLVSNELFAAVNVATKTVDPLDVENLPENDEIASQIKTALEAKIGDRIEVISVIVTLIKLDKEVQNRVDRLQTAVADTRIAKQKKQTAEAEAEANKILSDSVSNDPNVLVAKCLTWLDDVKDKGLVNFLPAGFDCWPGNNGSVVIPGVSSGGK